MTALDDWRDHARALGILAPRGRAADKPTMTEVDRIEIALSEEAADGLHVPDCEPSW